MLDNELLNNSIQSILEPPNTHPSRNNTFFVHIHIPKTGGTTFNTILEKNFENSFDRFEGRFIHLFPRVTRDQFLTYIETHTSIQAVTSHQFTIDLPFDESPRPIQAICFVRDPVKQFFSKYFHQRRYGMECPESTYSLDEYIDFKIKTGSFIRYNTFIAGADSKDAQARIHQAIEKGLLLVFPLERFDDSLQILQSIYPESFTTLNFSIKNVSPKDQTVTESMQNKVRDAIPLSNFELHNFSLDFVDQLTSTLNLNR